MSAEFSFQVPQELKQALGAGERLIWWDRPRPGLAFMRGDVIMIPFSIAWCSFMVFWYFLNVAVPKSVNWLFVIFGIPFAMIGIYILVGRYVHDAMKRRRTLVCLTNRRVLIQTSLFVRSMTSLALDQIADMTVESRASGEGTILFGREGEAASGFHFGEHRVKTEPLTITRIPNVEQVYQKILSAQAALKEARAPAGDKRPWG